MPKDTKYCDLEGRPHNCDVCSYCNSLVLCLTFGVQFTLRGGPGRGFNFIARRAMFLLSLISKHEMVRMGLVMSDGSLLTVRQNQQQTQIL